MSEKETYFQSKTSLNTWNEGYPDNCFRLAGRTAAHALAAVRWAGREENPAGLSCLKLEDFFDHEKHESHEGIDPRQLRAKRLVSLREIPAVT